MRSAAVIIEHDGLILLLQRYTTMEITQLYSPKRNDPGCPESFR
jgi:hypothetical protein